MIRVEKVDKILKNATIERDIENKGFSIVKSIDDEIKEKYTCDYMDYLNKYLVVEKVEEESFDIFEFINPYLIPEESGDIYRFRFRIKSLDDMNVVFISYGEDNNNPIYGDEIKLRKNPLPYLIKYADLLGVNDEGAVTLEIYIDCEGDVYKYDLVGDEDYGY